MSDNASTEVEKTHNARELSQSLSGSPEQRAEEIRTLTLTFAPRVRAEVEFTGMWSGRLVRSAFNAISKAYRRRRYKQIRVEPRPEPAKADKPEGGIGDGNVKVS